VKKFTIGFAEEHLQLIRKVAEMRDVSVGYLIRECVNQIIPDPTVARSNGVKIMDIIDSVGSALRKVVTLTRVPLQPTPAPSLSAVPVLKP